VQSLENLYLSLVSEDPNFKKLTDKHRHDMCLDNEPDCDIYVLIMDERFGEDYKG